MESYKRALGDHMRSHKFSLDEEEEEEEDRTSQLSYETESDIATSSSEEEDRKINEFNFTDSVLLYDDECSRNSNNITRKRSKRTRKLESLKKVKASQLCYKTELEIETHHSSASDTTTEEDLAFCLMMLSRDKWTNKEIESEDYNKSKRRSYKCYTCGKVFKSYQALGGHRASHKKIKTETEHVNVVTVSVVTEKRIHECPICFRVFQSGQALGGHKRSHGMSNLSANHQVHRIMIDLNLPAQIEEDGVSMNVE